MNRFLAITAASFVAFTTASAHAATTYDFNTAAVGTGHDAYSAGFTEYNAGSSTPANVAGVTFNGTSGVDDGAFGFPSDASQTAFLQSFTGLTDGSFTLGTLLTSGTSYNLSFDYVARPNDGVTFTVDQGSNLLGTYSPGTAFGSSSVSFVSNGGALTFAAVNTAGDHSTAIDNITVSAAPEPGTWALMFCGVFFAGGAMRISRRRDVSVARVA